MKTNCIPLIPMLEKLQVCVPVFAAEIILDIVRLALRYSRSCSVTRTTTTMSTVSSALYEEP